MESTVAMRSGTRPRMAPGPRSEGPLGHLRALRADPLGLLTRSAAEYGDVVALRFFNRRMHLLRHPEHVKYVLQDNPKNFTKQTIGYDRLREILGNGLVTSEGSFWLRQRRIMQPAFHRERVAAFGGTMVRLTEAMLNSWDEKSRRGEPLDVAAEMHALTLRIVCQTLLSAEVSSQTETVGHSLDELLSQVMNRTTGLLALPRWLPTPKNWRLKKARGALDQIIRGVISARLNGGRSEGDLLDLLIAARDEETGERMTDQQLRDEVMTIFLAGHETTANALSWTLLLLSEHPTVARTFRSELAQVLGQRTPTVEDLPRLLYTGQVIQEAMRLYPPVWLFVRQVSNDDEIGGYHIPRQSYVMLSPYLTHRDPEFWQNPEGFDPERFSADRLRLLPRFAYFPFGGGPRICIGNSFAQMEAQLVLASIAQRFELERLPGSRIELYPSVTLRARSGIPMTVRKR